MIFRAGTSDRPFFVRRLTATIIATALEVGAVQGTTMSISPSEAVSGASWMSKWYAELTQNSLGRGLLLVGAAVPFRENDADVEDQFQLTSAFADLFSTGEGVLKADAVRAFQDAALRDYGLDIRVERPSFD